MPGYPQFSFWILIALAKICFFNIFINRAKILLYWWVNSLRTRISRDAQNICAVTKGGTVLKLPVNLHFEGVVKDPFSIKDMPLKLFGSKCE